MQIEFYKNGTVVEEHMPLSLLVDFLSVLYFLNK